MASLKKMIVTALGLHRALTVESIADIAPSFRLCVLTGEALRSAAFAPGDKLQVMLDAGARTYTPFAFDATLGRLSLLVHLHDSNAPGATWGRRLAKGAQVPVFGPRSSLPLASLSGHVVLFGDETSFGVARALRDHLGDPSISLDDTARSPSDRCDFVFEVSSADESSRALRELGLSNDALVQRAAGDAHLTEVDQRVREALLRHPGSHLVLTGKAQSIQHIRAQLKASSVALAGQRVKAYWAPGKRGLD
jgi:ferric-chelate reductase (NADPH)